MPVASQKSARVCWENRLSDPIDYGSESCESEEGGGELLRAGGDAVVAFDASEEVFDLVTPAVNGLIPGKGVFSVAAWRDAGEPTQLVDQDAKFVVIEAFVADEEALSEPLSHGHSGVLLGGLARKEHDGNDVAVFIDGGGELGIEATFGFANALIERASDGALTILMDLDVGAVDEADLASLVTGEAGKDAVPNPAVHQPPPPFVDGVPVAEMAGDAAPPAAETHGVNDGL